MPFRVCFALLFWVSACTSVPASPSTLRPSAFAPHPSPPRIQFITTRTDLRPRPIVRADLEQARALLVQAREDLEPPQWESLAGKLTAAERAFDRFSQATKASGQAAEVVRGAEGMPQTGRSMTWVEVLPRVGPLFVFIVLLYPASTAGPEIDRRPEWMDAQEECETRLRELAEASRRLLEERGRQQPDLVSAVTEFTPWWKKPNPVTGKPYASVEEYDRVPRHPEQTCKNSRLDVLQEEKDLLNRAVPPLDLKSPGSWNEKKMAKVPCSRIRQRLEAQKKLLEKRWQVQKECFGGKPDPSHENAITEVEKALANTRMIEDQNCAPGHPMAEL